MINELAVIIFDYAIPLAMFVTLMGVLALLVVNQIGLRRSCLFNTRALVWNVQRMRELAKDIEAIKKEAINKTLRNIAKVVSKKAKRVRK